MAGFWPGSPQFAGLNRGFPKRLIGGRVKGVAVGLAFRPDMTKGDDRDPDERDIPTARDREIDVAFLAIALFFAGVIAFVLLFG